MSTEGIFASEEQAPVRVGDVLAGKYRIEHVLGRGGMGVVVAAHHVQLEERVAIKFLLPSALANQEVLGRFVREARAAVKIKSQHVARVIDVSTLENGAPYMVMEYLEGHDLAKRIERGGPLSVEEAAEVIIQACDAIVEAHSLGIVHRDLKPANLYCVESPDGLATIKVLDFGISKADGALGSMTQTQSMLGSPLYMSPEQMRSSKSVDARTDIWALGAILFECVTGDVPFKTDSMPELVFMVMEHGAPRASDRVQGIPPEFDEIIARCLERDLNLRYRNVGELATALLPFASDRARGNVDRILRIAHSAGMSNGLILSPRASVGESGMLPFSPTPMPGSSKDSGKFSSFGTGRTAAPSMIPREVKSRPSLPVATDLAAAAPISDQTLLLEGAPAPGKDSDPAAPGRTALSSTKSEWGSGSGTAGQKPSRPSPVLIALVAALTGVIATSGGLYFAFRTPRVPPNAAGSASTSASAPPPLVSVAAPVIDAAAPATSASAGVVTTAEVDAGKPAVVAAPVPMPVVQPQPQPQVKPVANCNPPYTFDADGNRVFKKECL